MTAESLSRIGADPDRFEAFYRRHLATVEAFVARRVGDPQDAADLTADVFVAAIDASAGYRGDRGSPAGWLLGIARHLVAGEYRRRARERNAVRRISGRRLLDPDSASRIIERIDAERETRGLYRAIAELPDRDRALLELVAIDGLSIADAAQVLGIRAGTARVRLHRSRASVQSRLRPRVDAALETGGTP